MIIENKTNNNKMWNKKTITYETLSSNILSTLKKLNHQGIDYLALFIAKHFFTQVIQVSSGLENNHL